LKYEKKDKYAPCAGFVEFLNSKFYLRGQFLQQTPYFQYDTLLMHITTAVDE